VVLLGLKPISVANWLPSVLRRCWLGHLACKNGHRNDLWSFEWDVKSLLTHLHRPPIFSNATECFIGCIKCMQPNAQDADLGLPVFAASDCQSVRPSVCLSEMHRITPRSESHLSACSACVGHLVQPLPNYFGLLSILVHPNTRKQQFIHRDCGQAKLYKNLTFLVKLKMCYIWFW